MIRKLAFLWILFFFIFSGCEKNNEIRQVTYRISENDSGFSVTYRDENGTLAKKSVEVTSAADIWTYSFQGKEGDILYVSSNYKDINSGLKVQILLDGKVYKQSFSQYDTLNFVTVSGTIPYN